MDILVVDDDPNYRRIVTELLKNKHDISQCENGRLALEFLKKNQVDLVITDQQMPELDGLELVKAAKELDHPAFFIIMTAFGTVKNAVDAIQFGVEDYIMKPFDLDDMQHRVDRIQKLILLNAEEELRKESSQASKKFLGNSQFAETARAFIRKVTNVTSPVLILGPSGSGKEVLARAVHESGQRSDALFVAINCACLSEELLESELFGHEKGAFTGATSSKQGKFEIAKGGTIFLDEVGELPANLQAKLLRVLQEKEFSRVGGLRQLKTDARVIAATNRPLAEMVKSGQFREDLYFRLNVLNFVMAPLGERREDIDLFVDFFWRKLTAEMGKKLELPTEVKAKLLSYRYPGNVRELQNIVERMVVLADSSGDIDVTLIAPEGERRHGLVTTDAKLSFDMGMVEQVDHLERQLVTKALHDAYFNQVKAAELLKISRGALQKKMKKFGIARETILKDSA